MVSEICLNLFLVFRSEITAQQGDFSPIVSDLGLKGESGEDISAPAQEHNTCTVFWCLLAARVASRRKQRWVALGKQGQGERE